MKKRHPIKRTRGQRRRLIVTACLAAGLGGCVAEPYERTASLQSRDAGSAAAMATVGGTAPLVAPGNPAGNHLVESARRVDQLVIPQPSPDLSAAPAENGGPEELVERSLRAADKKTLEPTVIPAGAFGVAQGSQPVEGEFLRSPSDRIPHPPGQTIDAEFVWETPPGAVPLDLAGVLSAVGPQTPEVGFARWRVQEAYARLTRAQTLWLPTIQSGFSFHRHDGNLQESSGRIIDVNRSSFQAGLGAGATGAGTTTRPGVVALFHTSDAIFQPRIAQATAWARGHEANAVLNETLLDAASAYIRLLEAVQTQRILEENLERTSELAELTLAFAETGQGLAADADRMQTELILSRGRLLEARENVAVASAQLAEAISFDPALELAPADIAVIPLDIVDINFEKSTLVGIGLANRPELKEAQALVAAACERYRREKFAPLVPSVLLGFSETAFGGDVGSSVDSVDDRYDFDAIVTWEVRNLGFGEAAARRETGALLEQAKFEKLDTMDEVARQVAEAHGQALRRKERVAITQQAIRSARDSYERNLSRIRDGQGLPIEALQSLQALEAAQVAYLQAVTAYNLAQFQLQWSLGWPIAPL